jgi:hypothetical protein
MEKDGDMFREGKEREKEKSREWRKRVCDREKGGGVDSVSLCYCRYVCNEILFYPLQIHTVI